MNILSVHGNNVNKWGVTSLKKKCFRLNPRVFVDNNVKLDCFVTVLTLITLQDSVHKYVSEVDNFYATLLSIYR